MFNLPVVGNQVIEVVADCIKCRRYSSSLLLTGHLGVERNKCVSQPKVNRGSTYLLFTECWLYYEPPFRNLPLYGRFGQKHDYSLKRCSREEVGTNSL